MNGSSLPSPELPLPKTSPEAGDRGEAIKGGENKPSFSDSVSQQGPTTPMPMVDPSKFVTGQNTTTVAPSAQISSSPPAADTDVIEKEWVMRAKAIVNNTRDNPNQQSKELSNFKTEYLKKRFDKDPKTSKEVAKEK